MCNWQHKQLASRATGNTCKWKHVQMATHANGNMCKWQHVQLATGATGNMCNWQHVHLATSASGNTCKWQYVQVATRASGNTCKWQHVRAVHEPYFSYNPIFTSCALKRASTRILGFVDILEFVCGKMFSLRCWMRLIIFLFCPTPLTRMNNIDAPPYLIF